MLHYSNYSGLPETYRITLAVSVAFFAHTALMATLPFDLPEHHHNPVTVSVNLVERQETQPQENTPSKTTVPVRATPFSVEASPSPQPSRSLQTTPQPQLRAVPKPAPDAATAQLTNAEKQTPPEPQSAPQTSQSATAVMVEAGITGTQSAKLEEPEAEVTLRSEIPSEEASYITLLAQTIAQKATIRRLENVEGKQVLNVEIELNLMSNGALIGARITDSSGHDGLDQRVYRAALEASPYPEPPSTGSRQQRFRVPFQYRF
jgi:protein TonB